MPPSVGPLALALIILLTILTAPNSHAASASARFSVPHADLTGGGGQAASPRFRIESSFTGLGGFASDTRSTPRYFLRAGSGASWNDPPVAQSATIDIPAMTEIGVPLSATDLDGDPLSFEIIAQPRYGSLAGTPPQLRYTPNTSPPRDDDFAFIARDGFNDSNPATITLRATIPPTQTPPIVNPVPDQRVQEGTTLAFPVNASDTDRPPQRLQYTVENGAPSGAIIDATTGFFTWTPSEAHGPATYRIGIRVTDNGSPAQSTVEEFQVVVDEANQPPRLEAISQPIVPAGVKLNLVLRATDPDLPAQDLRFSIVEGPFGSALDAQSGRFSWTPPARSPNSLHPVTVQVADTGSPPLQTRQQFIIQVVGAPILGIARTTPAQIQLQIQSVAGACLRIDESVDLEDWTPLIRGVADTNGKFGVTLDTRSENSGRWFRAVAIDCGDR